MTTKNLYQDYNVPELFDNGFIQSLAKQYEEKGYLSKMQEAVIEDTAGREVKLNITLDTYYKVRRYFYRRDYHGDYLQDSNIVYVQDFDKDEMIQDEHAAQYGSESYTNKYEFIEEVQIIKDLPTHYVTNFFMIYEKVKRNRFRKLKNRNKHIRYLNALNDKEYALAHKIWSKIFYQTY